MSFRPLNFEEGKVLLRRSGAITTVVGQALVITSGVLALATSSTGTDIEYVAAQAGTHSSGDLIRVWPATPDVLYEADCDAVVSTADVGTFCDLATNATLNPDATTHDLFKIEHIVGVAETSTKVEGRFTRDVTAAG